MPRREPTPGPGNNAGDDLSYLGEVDQPYRPSVGPDRGDPLAPSEGERLLGARRMDEQDDAVVAWTNTPGVALETHEADVTNPASHPEPLRPLVKGPSPSRPLSRLSGAHRVTHGGPDYKVAPGGEAGPLHAKHVAHFHRRGSRG